MSRFFTINRPIGHEGPGGAGKGGAVLTSHLPKDLSHHLMDDLEAMTPDQFRAFVMGVKWTRFVASHHNPNKGCVHCTLTNFETDLQWHAPPLPEKP